MQIAKIIFNKNNDNNKSLSSKKEIKKRLISKKNRNKNTVHPIVSYLSYNESSFKKEIMRIGYNEKLVEEIMQTGISTHDFNLFAEIISHKEKEIVEQDNKPINISNTNNANDNIDTSNNMNGNNEVQMNSNTNINRNNTINSNNRIYESNLNLYNKLKPTTVNLYTKDKVPKHEYHEW